MRSEVNQLRRDSEQKIEMGQSQIKDALSRQLQTALKKVHQREEENYSRTQQEQED